MKRCIPNCYPPFAFIKILYVIQVVPVVYYKIAFEAVLKLLIKNDIDGTVDWLSQLIAEREVCVSLLLGLLLASLKQRTQTRATPHWSRPAHIAPART